MSNAYKISILPMIKTTIDEGTGETLSTEQDDWYIFPDEVRVALTPILARHGYAEKLGEFPDADWLLSRVEFESRYKVRRRPWVLVFFADEYPILGHVVSHRSDSNLIKGSGYSLIRPGEAEYDPSTGIAPPVSMLWIFSKQALEEAAASGSMLFVGLLEELSHLDETESWIHFADPLSPDWVSKQSAIDNEFFFNFLKK